MPNDRIFAKSLRRPKRILLPALSLLAASVSLFSSSAPIVAPEPNPFPREPRVISEPAGESWSVMTLGGSPVGYLHETTKRSTASGAAVVRISSEMKMVLNRLGTKVEMSLLSLTEETERGILRRMTSELKASILSTRTEAVFREGKIELRSESGGKSYTRTIDAPGDLVGPEGVRLMTLKELKKPGDAIEYQTFEGELGMVTKGIRKVLAREPLALGGAPLETLKVEETIEAGGVTATLWLGPDGEALKQVMPTPFGEGVVVLSDRATALAAASGGELPPEMFERSIIRSNVRLPRARDIDRLTVRMTARTSGMSWPKIELPSQTVRARPDGSLEISVRRPGRPRSAAFPAAATEANREFLEPNAYVQSDLPELKALAAKVAAGAGDRFAAAVKLRDWVGANMTFDLGIAIAPSSEILRDRRGTCVGYATLLAALARALGIPSRVVIGYVYADGMFGGHAWAEIDAGGAWIPIDAAVPSAGVADAARIGVTASSLREGAGALGAGGASRIFGQVDLRVEKFGVAGGPETTVPQAGPLYRIEGDVYENPGLGLVFHKPAGAAFTELDAVWPDPTLLALELPDGTKATLSEALPKPWSHAAAFAAEALTAAGIRGAPARENALARESFAVRAPGEAGLVVLDGPAAWVLTVKGAEAPGMLNRLVEGWTLSDFSKK
jgi:transglutaminase-like putative cysteine protease